MDATTIGKPVAIIVIADYMPESHSAREGLQIKEERRQTVQAKRQKRNVDSRHLAGALTESITHTCVRSVEPCHAVTGP